MIDRRDWRNAREICYVSSTVPEGYLEMFSYERHRDDGDAFMEAFEMFRDNSNQATVRGLVQRHGDRYLVQNRPRRPLEGTN